MLFRSDDSILKQIARGNPAIVYIKDGVILWKQNMQAISIEQFTQKSDEINDALDTWDDKRLPIFLLLIYSGSMLVLLLINRSHNVWKFTTRRNQNNENKDVPLQSE